MIETAIDSKPGLEILVSGHLEVSPPRSRRFAKSRCSWSVHFAFNAARPFFDSEPA